MPIIENRASHAFELSIGATLAPPGAPMNPWGPEGAQRILTFPPGAQVEVSDECLSYLQGGGVPWSAAPGGQPGTASDVTKRWFAPDALVVL